MKQGYSVRVCLRDTDDIKKTKLNTPNTIASKSIKQLQEMQRNETHTHTYTQLWWEIYKPFSEYFRTM